MARHCVLRDFTSLHATLAGGAWFCTDWSYNHAVESTGARSGLIHEVKKKKAQGSLFEYSNSNGAYVHTTCPPWTHLTQVRNGCVLRRRANRVYVYDIVNSQWYGRNDFLCKHYCMKKEEMFEEKVIRMRCHPLLFTFEPTHLSLPWQCTVKLPWCEY